MDDVSPYVIQAQLAALRAIRAADDLPEGVWWESTPYNIVMMVSPDFDHAEIREKIAAQLRGAVPDGLRVQNDVAFMNAALSERTPDLFVIDSADMPEFRDGHFLSMQGVKLILEVTSRATRSVDLRAKPTEYAASGVPIYLIVDRKTPEVVVMHGPCRGKYAHIDSYPVGKDVPLPAPINLTLDMAFLPDYLD